MSLRQGEIKKGLYFRWQPTAELALVFVSWITVVGGLWLAFQVFTTQKVALNFITFGPITLFGFGIALPLLWTVMKGRSLAEVGITQRKAIISIMLGLAFSIIQYTQTIARVTLPPVEQLIPIISMAVTVGLFEAIFFRGWMQLRFEEMFGVVPGIVLGAGFYAMYHLGYGMEWNEIGFLFIIGLIFAAVFRITKNILILWPFFTPMGGLFNNIKEGLFMPFEATYGFVMVLGLMVTLIALIYRSALRFTRRANMQIKIL